MSGTTGTKVTWQWQCLGYIVASNGLRGLMGSSSVGDAGRGELKVICMSENEFGQFILQCTCWHEGGA